MSDFIHILVVDDHPVVRDGLVIMLGTQPDFKVVGEASNGIEALRFITEMTVDVLLLDLEMPQMDGLETLRKLREVHPDVNVLVFTAYDTDERIVGAVKAGAKGYLLKGAPREDIFNAIRVVSQGGSLLQPIIASKLMQHISHKETDKQVETLTEREMEVLRLLADGNANKEIAASLFITERTVKFHVSSILGKLGADNRTEVVRIAAQRGLVNFDSK
jgi:two-component system, NarL family, response regulator LiaR